ncbi:hypothetical protein GmRootA79_37380 [Acidovorax sp. A79]|uniref:transposase n=1 Tax=Acidovorax sp. A79 TaxID=3056107 RepID=UPI0034E8D5FD
MAAMLVKVQCIGYRLVDRTVVRAHQEADLGNVGQDCGPEAFPRCLSTKIHLAGDEQGPPLRLILKPELVNDFIQAPELLRGFAPTHVLADKGCDNRALVV